MQGNDLDNRSTPSILVVFEGIVALPPKKSGSLIPWSPRKQTRVIHPAKAYHLDTLVQSALWRLSLTHTCNIEIVTFLGPDFARDADKILRENHYPHQWVRSFDSPEHLARELIRMPYVSAVYDVPQRQFTYGHLTRAVAPHLRGEIGYF